MQVALALSLRRRVIPCRADLAGPSMQQFFNGVILERINTVLSVLAEVFRSSVIIGFTIPSVSDFMHGWACRIAII